MKDKQPITFKDGFNAAVGFYVGQTIVTLIGLAVFAGIGFLLYSLA